MAGDVTVRLDLAESDHDGVDSLPGLVSYKGVIATGRRRSNVLDYEDLGDLEAGGA